MEREKPQDPTERSGGGVAVHLRVLRSLAARDVPVLLRVRELAQLAGGVRRFRAAPRSSAQPPRSGALLQGDPRSDGRYFYSTARQEAAATCGRRVNEGCARREHAIPSPLRRFLAEAVDFLILFCVKAAVILTIAHLSGWRDPSKFAVHFIVEEMDEETSLEELQKMMLLPLLYRMLVRLCETFCIWGAGGATPGKFLLGLRVVTCDTSVLVQPDRVQAVPASDVSLSASTVRALNKNFSIAFFFPAFIAPLFFQHNGTVYDIAAGTVVVKRSRAR
ncbi:protein FAM8A1-like [Scleropages formosus]|uniref:Protein FAM8A1-like n=1 Tax=Scleropages formosus TaxID=113540 RepID=A0A0P7YQA2_SCLFO|nr:protein FAM8A1-like [Scleropages formosus]